MHYLNKFIAVGAFNTILGYCLIFTAMYLFRISPEMSNVIGYIVGLLSSYILNRKFTFNSMQEKYKEFFYFIVVFCIAYVANFLVLLILIHSYSIREDLSQILAGVAYVGISFLLNKYIVFGKQ